MSTTSQVKEKRSRTRRVLVGLTVSFVTLLILAIVLEIGVRLFVSEETFRPLANIYAPHTDPEVGYTMRPNHTANTFGVPLRANRWGFRGPDWTVEKPSGAFRIALIGDSHAFAYGVRFEAGVSERLALILNANEPDPGTSYEVLNFSLPGYNSEQQRAVFEKIALRFDPDIVILLYCQNDHDPAMWSDDQGWLHIGEATANSAEEARALGWCERSFVNFQNSITGNSKLLLYLRISWLKFRQTQRLDKLVSAIDSDRPLVPADAEVAKTTISDPLLRRVYEPLSAIASECEKRRIPIVFTCLSGEAEWLALLRKLAEKHAAPSLSLMTLFPEAASYKQLMERFSLGWDSHLNGTAHDRWARAVADVLTKQRLIRPIGK